MRRRPHQAALFVLASQVCFFGMLAICIPLAPQAVRHHLGVSYFGTNHATVPAYVIGLLLTGYFLVKAAHALPQHSARFRTLSEILLILAILVVGVCLTPPTWNASSAAVRVPRQGPVTSQMASPFANQPIPRASG